MRELNAPSSALLAALAASILVSACARVAGKHSLPERPPPAPKLEFSGRGEGWPPHPAGQSKVESVAWTPIARELPPDAEVRRAVLDDARVRQALGARFGYIGADAVEPPKDRAAETARRATRVTLYSYSNNTAVEVLLEGATVTTVTLREGYQPPESTEEIAAAIALARRATKIARATVDLDATAILVFPGERNPGHGHRVLHVTFGSEEEPLPRYFALVDLTSAKVLSSGPVGR